MAEPSEKTSRAELPGLDFGSDGGPLDSAVRVRYTFLDSFDASEDAPGMQSLERCKTAPPEGHFTMLTVPVEECEENEESSTAVDVGGTAPAPIPEPATGDFAPAPPAEGLYRSVTLDGYDPAAQWMWADPDLRPVAEQVAVQSAVENTPLQVDHTTFPSPAPMPTPMMPIMVPVMFVPANMPQSVMMGPLANMPQNCVPVPVQGFERWPGTVIPPQAMESAPQPAPIAAPLSAEPPLAPPPPTNLQRAVSATSGKHRVHWSVEARKLDSFDRSAVSPKFPILLCGRNVLFSMMVHPTVSSDGRGGSSFKRSHGRGRIEVKCEEVVESGVQARARYRLSVGSSDSSRQQGPRGPVVHDFATSTVSGLPRNEQEWDFKASLDEGSKVVVVVLEISEELTDCR